jgi:apolipoprotein N-acyltransferase
MIAIACALLSAIGFYFSTGLGEQWWLVWFAPIPILWFVFGDTKWWQAFLAAWAAYALGSASPLQVYGGFLPLPVIVESLLGPSLLFAISAMAGRRVFRNVGPVWGALAFAALWTMFDFFIAFNKGGGSGSTPATSQVGAPLLMQSASLFGQFAITFLIGFFGAGIAASLRTRTALPAAAAIALFVANAAFGYWQISTPPTAMLRTALIDSDDTDKTAETGTQKDFDSTVDAYVKQIEALRGEGVKLIVIPEKLARTRPQWVPAAQAKLAAAAKDAGATLVLGLDMRDGAKAYNVSWAFAPGANTPAVYSKRHFVPKLEDEYTEGPGPLALANGTGLEICKDMDFEGMIRRDTVATKPLLLAVPAWDFGKDGWSHGRIAILHSVENGVPMARAARDGLLTLNDRYGRLAAVAKTTDGFKTLIGNLPLDGRGGETLFDRIGDLFAWLCAALGLGLVALSYLRPRRRSDHSELP